LGSNPNSTPRYYYVYNGHGDVVALVDASGNPVASYSYDAFGQLTAASENFGGTTTWTNPYRYDGRDGVRYDGETGLYWMSVRAYDPTLGRFLSRDPLGRSPLFFSDQPYVYGGNNPLINVDPSGQFAFEEGMSHAQVKQARAETGRKMVKWFRMHPYAPDPERIRSAWIRYLNHLIYGNNVTNDKINIVADLGIFALDLGLALAGDAVLWVTAIADVLEIGSDIVNFIKDDSLYNGNTGNAQVARQWGSVISALSVIANLISTVTNVA